MSWLETRKSKSNTNVYTKSVFQVCSRSLTCRGGWAKSQHYMTNTLYVKVVYELQFSF